MNSCPVFEPGGNWCSYSRLPMALTAVMQSVSLLLYASVGVTSKRQRVYVHLKSLSSVYAGVCGQCTQRIVCKSWYRVFFVVLRRVSIKRSGPVGMPQLQQRECAA